MPSPKRALFAVLFVLFLIPGLCRAESLGYAKPEEAGFSRERLDRIISTLNDDVAKGTIPGATLLILRNGKIALYDSVGWLDPATKTPMPKDAIFRIYSMSKPITSVAAMILVEQGKLLLGDPVQKYIPAFAQMKVALQKPGTETFDLVPAARPITVQDLMRHTSGLTYGFMGVTPVAKMYEEAHLAQSDDGTNASFADNIAKLPLAVQPGSSWNYSHSTDVLGRVVEVASGKSLYQFEKENILDPLGMTDTAFSVPPAKQNLIAEALPSDSKVVGTLPLSNPRRPATWEAGGQGMVSTALDYGKFTQMLQNGGTLDGHRILGPATVAYMTSDHLGQIPPGPTAYLPGPANGFGLGFAVRRQSGVGASDGSAGDYYWGGAAGTAFWIDPKQHLTVVFMVQAPSQGSRYTALLRNMIYAALTEVEK
jgi:CubicO group peptidase (beta-lactamase class C family)